MSNILLNSTAKTPEVRFDSASGILEIEGRLIPENPDEFFSVLYNSLNSFKRDNSENTILLRLHYYNTTSSKRLLHFFQKAEELYQSGCKLKIIWEYEDGDDDSMRDGEDYQQLLKIPFEVKLE
ncbi:MAG: DUF1987 domain-containing protein [Bacteroidetes bacterium]|nr:DUF1987 domain-containing protein [Bacteroidota bacterium]